MSIDTVAWKTKKNYWIVAMCQYDVSIFYLIIDMKLKECIQIAFVCMLSLTSLSESYSQDIATILEQTTKERKTKFPQFFKENPDFQPRILSQEDVKIRYHKLIENNKKLAEYYKEYEVVDVKFLPGKVDESWSTALEQIDKMREEFLNLSGYVQIPFYSPEWTLKKGSLKKTMWLWPAWFTSTKRKNVIYHRYLWDGLFLQRELRHWKLDLRWPMWLYDIYMQPICRVVLKNRRVISEMYWDEVIFCVYDNSFFDDFELNPHIEVMYNEHKRSAHWALLTNKQLIEQENNPKDNQKNTSKTLDEYLENNWLPNTESFIAYLWKIHWLDPKFLWSWEWNEELLTRILNTKVISNSVIYP